MSAGALNGAKVKMIPRALPNWRHFERRIFWGGRAKCEI